jgi:hypothetical protein
LEEKRWVIGGQERIREKLCLWRYFWGVHFEITFFWVLTLVTHPVLTMATTIIRDRMGKWEHYEAQPGFLAVRWSWTSYLKFLSYMWNEDNDTCL